MRYIRWVTLWRSVGYNCLAAVIATRTKTWVKVWRDPWTPAGVVWRIRKGSASLTGLQGDQGTIGRLLSHASMAHPMGGHSVDWPWNLVQRNSMMSSVVVWGFSPCAESLIFRAAKNVASKLHRHFIETFTKWKIFLNPNSIIFTNN